MLLYFSPVSMALQETGGRNPLMYPQITSAAKCLVSRASSALEKKKKNRDELYVMSFMSLLTFLFGIESS